MAEHIFGRGRVRALVIVKFNVHILFVTFDRFFDPPHVIRIRGTFHRQSTAYNKLTKPL